MPDVKDIIALMEERLSEDEKALVLRASAFAQEKHEGHERNSGEPYYIHLFETARELAELGMGPNTVAAGFLHDCIEDAKVTPKELEKEFGAEILFLVEGVSKLGKLKYQGAERHAESLRRLFVATSQDIRVLMIKLMDRLHNMRTLEHVRPDKRVRIAKETLEIYAPIVDRLNMGRLKRELEDLSFKWVDPRTYEEMQAIIKERGFDQETKLTTLMSAVNDDLKKNGVTNYRTTFRIKGAYSLCKKLERKENDLDRIHDILAIRIIVPSVADCYHALGVVHGLYRPRPGKIKDFIAFPKPNGYRSLHTTVITEEVGLVEIQIRTEEMHREAQFGIASHFAYKSIGSKKSTEHVRSNRVWYEYLIPSLFSRKPTALEETASVDFSLITPSWIKDIGQSHNDASSETDQFLEGLRSDFFNFRVFVFTPKGDVIDLPIDSSPIDFAYAIHSDIGDHLSAAKVNGKLASFDSKLKNGDIVEIETKPSCQPTQKWLDYVKTSLARRHIANFIQKQHAEQMR